LKTNVSLSQISWKADPQHRTADIAVHCTAAMLKSQTRSK